MWGRDNYQSPLFAKLYVLDPTVTSQELEHHCAQHTRRGVRKSAKRREGGVCGRWQAYRRRWRRRRRWR